MAKDIVPELLAKIEADFRERYNSSSIIRTTQEWIQGGRGTYKVANQYAIETGRLLADALKANLSADILPDGRMYYNIAERILSKTMGNNHQLISQAAAQVQTDLNKAAGMRIKGLEAPLNKDRIDGLVERLSGELDFDQISWIIDEPVVNFSQSIIDDTIKANVDLHARLGLKPKIVRTTTGDCCDWCAEVAGTYEYPAPQDVYRRHQRCRCTVDYFPGDGRKERLR